MNIRDFSDKHGLKAIVRRHFVYNKPALPVDANTMCALIYSRTIDPSLLGLSEVGLAQAYRQGEQLVEMGIIPCRIVSGTDLRNTEGARQTAAAIRAATNKRMPFMAAPGVTYPYYDATKVVPAWEQFGDMAAHAYLAGRPEVDGLWTETADAFEERIVSAINNLGHHEGPVLFDLNFEQLVLLHYTDVKHWPRPSIPYDNSAWIPKNGGGIVYGEDGTVAEFNPDFTLVE